MVTQEQMIGIKESVIAAEIDGEAVLLDVDRGIYFGLDEVGTRIWNLLTEGVPVEAIRAQLLTEYDVEPERLDADVSAFLDRLVTKGLARSHDAS